MSFFYVEGEFNWEKYSLRKTKSNRPLPNGHRKVRKVNVIRGKTCLSKVDKNQVPL